jgi:hypothetical protein
MNVYKYKVEYKYYITKKSSKQKYDYSLLFKLKACSRTTKPNVQKWRKIN